MSFYSTDDMSLSLSVFYGCCSRCFMPKLHLKSYLCNGTVIDYAQPNKKIEQWVK